MELARTGSLSAAARALRISHAPAGARPPMPETAARCRVHAPTAGGGLFYDAPRHTVGK
ncbi:hypothetical protein [Azospirillum himalayense]|uniref:LysR family transcriptional regulator n=1 Tax=Azospirillum himalayense TaxID=654847 RepID=A0ABW0G8P7_9PROT